MEVILQEEVDNLGSKDEVVEVADGYARNFLLPRGLAKRATEGNLKNLEQKKQAKKKRQEKVKEQAQRKADKIDGELLEVAVQAGEEGQLFGSVTSNDIVDKIKQELGVEVDKRDIQLEGNIKNLGVTKVDIKLHPDVTPTVKIKVVEK